MRRLAIETHQVPHHADEARRQQVRRWQNGCRAWTRCIPGRWLSLRTEKLIVVGWVKHASSPNIWVSSG